MKYKWYWTPGGWLRVIIVVGLLMGGVFTEGTISIVMLVLGMLVFISGYIATARHIAKRNKEVKTTTTKL